MKIKEKKRKMKEAKQSGEKVIHNKLMFYDTILGLGQYGKQPIWYVFDTDIADIIHSRYGTRFGLIYSVNPTNTSAKANWSPVYMYCVPYFYSQSIFSSSSTSTSSELK